MASSPLCSSLLFALRFLLLMAFSHVATAAQGISGGTCNHKTTCPSQTTCQPYHGDHDDRRCLHKPLFPMNGQDIIAIVLVVLASSLSAGGGIGGGGLLVPIYVLVLNFETNVATALSLATISGGSIANLYTYVQRYHPNPVVRRPLIDYEASLLFGPPLLAGTIVGSLFSVIFPEWLVVVCLVLLLGFSAFKTLSKGIAKFKQQSAWQNYLENEGSSNSMRETEMAGVVGGDGRGLGVLDEEREGYPEGGSSVVVPHHHHHSIGGPPERPGSKWRGGGGKWSFTSADDDVNYEDEEKQEGLEEGSKTALVEAWNKTDNAIGSSSSSSTAPPGVPPSSLGENSAPVDSSRESSARPTGLSTTEMASQSQLVRKHSVRRSSKQDPSSAAALAAVESEVSRLLLLGLHEKGDDEMSMVSVSSHHSSQRSTSSSSLLDSGGPVLLMNDMRLKPLLRTMYREDSTLTPWWKFAAMFVVWTVVLVFALLRGGRGGPSVVGARCGGVMYWGLFFLNLALLFSVTVNLREMVMTRYELKKSFGHVDEEGDLQWTREASLKYPLIAILAGVAAGLLGIGGGMVLGPLLLNLGCDPLTTAATSAFAVLITATSGLSQVAIFGLVPIGYAWFFAIVGVASTFAGQTVVDYLVKKFKKDAIVILIIGTTMAVALVLMSIAGIVKLAMGAPAGFAELC